MNVEERRQMVISQFKELRNKYARLRLSWRESGDSVIAGILGFSATYKETTIEDQYEVELMIHDHYPEALPVARETDGRIPRDFHTTSDGFLCLGPPLEVRMKFSRQKSLLGFTDELLIPFLYSFSYQSKYGRLPYGELPHGWEGIAQYYKDLFKVNEDIHVLGLLRILADDDYRGHLSCPCGSGSRLRHCHGEHLLEIKEYQPPEDFLAEYVQVLQHVQGRGDTKIPREFLSKTIIRQISKDSKSSKK